VAGSLREMGYDPVWEDPSTPDGIGRGLVGVSGARAEGYG
jgi:hypothetical protein